MPQTSLWGASSAQPDPWLDLRGLLLREGMREEGREEKEGEGRRGEGRGGEGREEKGGRGGLSGNVAEEAFFLKSAPDY